ncbi:hypothetical protein scyTo_0021139, partial [Scyliorhinus torazame]|nr:hypothetical protein [Scyliorhinus torazame]
MRDEAICPICLDFFTHPVTIDCGHNFCQGCILGYWAPQRGKVSCPQCRRQFTQRNVRPNHFVSNIVAGVRQLSLDGGQAGAGTEPLCLEHGEELKLFCQEDQRAICVVCSLSRDHKPHTVSPIKEAADLYKQQAKGLRKNIASKFDQLHQFLHQEEKDLKTKLQQNEESILQKIKENLNKISEQQVAFERTLTEMQRRLTLQEAEFLKGINCILD